MLAQPDAATTTRTPLSRREVIALMVITLMVIAAGVAAGIGALRALAAEQTASPPPRPDTKPSVFTDCTITSGGRIVPGTAATRGGLSR